MDFNPTQILTELTTRQKAAGDFLLFVKYTKRNFFINWHHRVIAEKLQDFAEGRIKKLMIFLQPQCGKFLPYDTPVFTTKGFKAHGLLRPGDFVFGDDGSPKKVIANSGVYKWNVDKINFQCGRSILAAKEHLWKLQVEHDHKGRKECIEETQNIFKKKHRRSPAIKIPPALKTKKKSLPIDPYILGCWLGDGSHNLGSITVGKEDIEHFKKFGKRSTEVKPGIYSVLIDGLRVKLRKNRLLLNKHIPINYLLASIEQKRELLTGLMDTDGCCDKRGTCEFTQMEGQLAEDVYILLRTLGIKANIHYYKAMLNKKQVGIKTRIFFSPNKTDVIFKLKRKQTRILDKKMDDREDKYKLFIESIEPHGLVDGNCIEVEGGMYLAGYDLIPTHNSELSTRRLPAYILGRYPDKKIAICAYNQTFASKFNRDLQRIIDDPIFKNVFPDTRLNDGDGIVRNSEEFEIANHKGFLKAVGIGGALTGTTVDIGIIDDPIKDALEAYSTTYRDRVGDWYDTVFKTRLHNESQQLITLTRWHEDDLAGRILKAEGGQWEVIIFPAIKEDLTNDLDTREIGEVLWPEKHSAERMLDVKGKNPLIFASLYQQRPYYSEEEGRFAFAFSRAKHVGKCLWTPSQYTYLSFDFNRNPICCTVIQWYNETIFIPKCIKLKNSNIYKLCELIVKLYPGAAFIVTGDATGRSSSALVEDNVNYYVIIKRLLSLNEAQIKVSTINPRIESNQVLVNALLQNYKWVIDPDESAAVIFDMEYVKMLPDGTIDKSNRQDPSKQAEAIDCVRYFCDKFMGYFLKFGTA